MELAGWLGGTRWIFEELFLGPPTKDSLLLYGCKSPTRIFENFGVQKC